MGFEEQYRSQEKLLHRTSTSVVTLLKSLLDAEGTDYLSVTSRIKTLSSCLEKIERKNYKEPLNSITDFVGLRIIVYFEHQIKAIETLIRSNFEIDEENSNSKDLELGQDKIGYRSLHLTCKIDRNRSNLKEYKQISNQIFELQIRTVLQHAWAELAHDRAYKLTGGLPAKIQREVNLYAGMLEIADKAFSRIIKDIDDYKENISDTNISEKPINTLTLQRFIDDFSRKNSIKLKSNIIIDDIIVRELKSFGFKTIGSIEEKLDVEFITAEKKYENNDTSIGLLRNIMMWVNPSLYFRKCWNESWQGLSPDTIEMMVVKHPNFESIIDQYDVSIEEFDEDTSWNNYDET